MPCAIQTRPLLRRAGCVLALSIFVTGCDVGELERLHATAPQGEIDRGRLLLGRYQCGSCHTIPGVTDARGEAATSLVDFGRRAYIAGRLPNDPRHLAAWIADPKALVAQTTMPSMGASEADARAMAAYLLTLE